MLPVPHPLHLHHSVLATARDCMRHPDAEGWSVQKLKAYCDPASVVLSGVIAPSIRLIRRHFYSRGEIVVQNGNITLTHLV